MKSNQGPRLTRYRVIWDPAINSGALVQMGGAFKRVPCPDDGVILASEAEQALAAKNATIRELEEKTKRQRGEIRRLQKYADLTGLVKKARGAAAAAEAPLSASMHQNWLYEMQKTKRLETRIAELEAAQDAIRQMSEPEPADPPVTRRELAGVLEQVLWLLDAEARGLNDLPLVDMVALLEIGQDARGEG